MTRLSIILFLLLIVLVACDAPKTETPAQIPATPTPTTFQPVAEMLPIGDGGLIFDQPCPSPCFFDIRIGETRLNQVVSILANHGISPCDQFNERIIVCGEDVFSIIVGANASTFIVDGITYYPSISISIGQIIEKYGNPTLVQVEAEGTPEASTVTMFLLWDSIKLKVDLPEIGDIGDQNYVIKNTTEIRAITFMDNISYTKLSAGDYVQNWKGYGEYTP